MADLLIATLVTQWLPEADVGYLTALCTQYKLDVPNEKVGDKAALLKIILRYLNSVELEQTADKGQGVLMKLFGELGDHLQKGQRQPKPEPVVINQAGNVLGPGARAAAAVAGGGVAPPAVLNHTKFHQFKLDGSVGYPGQEGTLSYGSLCFKIRQGKDQGYTFPEILSGVIRAMKPDLKLRTYFETHNNLTEEAFLSDLRSHFSEKNSAKAFQQLSECYQGQDENESAHGFVVRAMTLRDKVENMSSNEGAPWNALQLKSTFFHSVYTGLKANGIRMELQSILKEAVMVDSKLLDEVASAEANESERMKKIEEKKQAQVNSVSKDSNSSNNKTANSKKQRTKADKQVDSRSNAVDDDERAKLTATINQLGSKLEVLSTENKAMRNEM